MIGLYRTASERAPDDLALAAALGRVYFELEMLDEAADHFERLEVRAREFPVVHAFLGAIFERRGEMREAFEEYRRALSDASGGKSARRSDAAWGAYFARAGWMASIATSRPAKSSSRCCNCSDCSSPMSGSATSW